MIIHRRILACAVLLLGAACAPSAAPSVARTPPSREADVYAVWGVMVDSLLGARYDRRLPVILDTLAVSPGPRSAQAPYGNDLRATRNLFGVTDEMIAAYTSADSTPVRIDAAVLARYTRLNVVGSPADVPNLEEIRRARMVGTVHLSLVAFNPPRTLALVQGSWVCGPLCGHGFTAVMEKGASGRWREKTTLMQVMY